MPMWYETTARSSAPKRARARLEIAHRARERGLRVEALVDSRPLLGQPLRLVGLPDGVRAVDLLRQRSAALEVDAHPEQVGGSRGDDLGQPRRALRIAPGDHLRSTCALEEDDRLEHVGGDVARCGGVLDLVAVARDEPSRRERAAGAVRVEDVRRPRRGPGFELAAALGRVGERIVVERRPREAQRPHRRVVVRDEPGHQPRDDDQRGTQRRDPRERAGGRLGDPLLGHRLSLTRRVR